MRPIIQALAAVALAATACAPVLAWAGGPKEENDPKADLLAQARERFAAARKLEDAGKWAEALTLFQRVAEVKMTPQVRFHIALCMENVGLWTQALDGYAQAANEAGPGAPEVVKEANDHLRQLETSIPTVSLRVDGATAEDELYLDRRPIPLDDRPLPIRADPGPHTAEVRRAGVVIAREYFALAPRSTRRIELKIGNVAPPPGAPPVLRPPRDGRVQRIAGWSMIGVGAGSVVATGVFIGLRADAMSRLEKQCPGLTQCSRSVAPIVSEGKTDAALVNVFAIVGGVAAAGGLALLLTAPSTPPATGGAPPKAARIELAPAVGLDTFGLVVRGLF